MAEKHVKQKIKAILKAHKPHVKYTMKVPFGMGTNGEEDFTVCAYGRFLAIEAKADELHKQSALQTNRERDIKEAHGIYIVIHSGNLHILQVLLNEIRRRFMEQQNVCKKQFNSSSAAAR